MGTESKGDVDLISVLSGKGRHFGGRKDHEYGSYDTEIFNVL